MEIVMCCVWKVVNERGIAFLLIPGCVNCKKWLPSLAAGNRCGIICQNNLDIRSKTLLKHGSQEKIPRRIL